MSNPLKKIIPFLKARYAPRGAGLTFAQSGEDVVLWQLCKRLGVKKPFYLDIGAHHPVFGNTTYLLYKKGGRGILVEPNPTLCEVAGRKRSGDVCVNAGVGTQSGEADFYIFERSTRSTFSPEQAREWQKTSGQEPRVEKRPVTTLDALMDKYAKGRIPDVVSIDAEGLDKKIIEVFSFKVRPKIFCIEMSLGIKELMEGRGYVLVASIFENAIFLDKNIDFHI